jgi:cytosine/adenosine deaminase-related metal-dependent hydrolase
MGIAPVFAMLDHGVIVGLGMDDKEFTDDKDIITEMRLAARLHRITSHRLDSAHLLPSDVFRMATQFGAQTLGFDDLVGTLSLGKQADIVLLNLTRMSEPFLSADVNPIDLLVYRGRGIDVHTVLVGGQVVLRERELTRVDRQEVLHRLRESIPQDYVDQFKAMNQLWPHIRSSVVSYFEGWYDDMEQVTPDPFYLMNNQDL